MRLLIVYCLLWQWTCTTLQAQEAAKSEAKNDTQGLTEAEQSPEDSIRIYPLKHIKSSVAISMLQKIGPKGVYADDSRLNSVVVRVKEEDHDQIVALLENFDQQNKSNEVTEIIQGQAKEIAASGQIVTKLAEMSGVDLAYDSDLGIFMVKGPKEDVERVIAMIDRISLLSRQSADQSQRIPQPLMLRVLWLSNDPGEGSKNMIQSDTAIEKAIQKLAALGYADMKVKMQLIGRCDLIQGKANCQVDGSHSSGSKLRKLNFRAALSGAEAGSINGELKILADVTDSVTQVGETVESIPSGETTRSNNSTTADHLRSPKSTASTQVEVAIHLQPLKYYVLSAGPLGGYQSAFVVQLIEDF